MGVEVGGGGGGERERERESTNYTKRNAVTARMILHSDEQRGKWGEGGGGGVGGWGERELTM